MLAMSAAAQSDWMAGVIPRTISPEAAWVSFCRWQKRKLKKLKEEQTANRYLAVLAL
jgi:hypothetical protein